MVGAEAVAVPGAGGRARELATRVATGAGLMVLAAASISTVWTFSALVCLAASLALLEWMRFGMFARPLRALLGLVYVAFPTLALVLLRRLPEGLGWIVYVFAIVWSADIAAYAVGRIVGGPKLWPSVSPSKTWAGFAGACLAGMAASVPVWWAIEIGKAGSASIDKHHAFPLRATIAGLLLGALAQGGDLFESWLKRRAGVKDSGTLLPGHGGVLDRLDSLVPVAPAVAVAVWAGWL